MSGPVRLGLVGAGRWGRAYLRSMGDVPAVVLTRVASRNPATHTLVPDGCTVSSDWRTVVAADDVDGIIVATPPDLHAEMAAAALHACGAVLVEKPVATTARDASALVDLARLRRGILHVDHIDLFNPGWIALKDHLNETGRILRLTAVFGKPGPARSDVTPHWDWAPHPLALALDLLGSRPTRIDAHREILAKDEGGILEQVEIQLAFDGGVDCSITTGNAFGERHRQMIVAGTEATLVYDDTVENKLVRSKQGETVPLPVGPGLPLSNALDAFARAICRGDPDWAAGALGADVVQVIETVEEKLRVRG